MLVGKPGCRFVLLQQSVEGDHAYIWSDSIYEQATDTFHVRDGKITVQSFASNISPKQ